jgi:TDG/mug DNA glycosylase family protein
MGAYRHAFATPGAPLGEQPGPFEGARVWVLPSPSGLNAAYQLDALVRWLRRLKRA